MEMILKLKEETRELHDRIEQENLARHIMDHSIDPETYKLLLLQNYIAYRITENEIQKFLPNYKASKHGQLKQDLDQLGVYTGGMDQEDLSFTCHCRAEALGAAYVVEGSALGGLLLAKNLQKCDALSGIKQHYFFNGDKENLQHWNSFKQELENYDFSPAQELKAVSKARETFELFATIFRMELLPDRV